MKKISPSKHKHNSTRFPWKMILQGVSAWAKHRKIFITLTEKSCLYLNVTVQESTVL